MVHWPEHKGACAKCRACGEYASFEDRCGDCGTNFCSAACREADVAHGKQCGKRCGHCGAKQETMMQCSKCEKVVYCDRECQSAHWKTHRPDCKK